VRLPQLRETLERDQSARGDGGVARRCARDVNRRIVEDEGGDNPLVFSTANQNIMAVALLLRAMPEPSTPEGRRVHQGLCGLLEQAVVQNAKSSTIQGQDARGMSPLPTRHRPCRARNTIIRKGALKPHLSMSASRPMWMSGPPSRPDVVTGTRPSLDATAHAEAEGTTPITTAARRLSLRVPVSSARLSAGLSSRLDSFSQRTSPSTQGRPTPMLWLADNHLAC
jgi:hypothetical protein